MSKPRRDRQCLAGIMEATQRIIAYAEKLSYEQFLNKIQVRGAVLRNGQVIGKAW